MEHGGAVRKWNRVIRVEPTSMGRPRYRDSIDIEADALSPLIRAYARLFLPLPPDALAQARS